MLKFVYQVVEYALDKRKYTKFSRNLSENHPKQWLSRGFPVINVTFDPLNSNVIIMHDDSTICVIDKKKVSLFSKTVLVMNKSQNLQDTLFSTTLPENVMYVCPPLTALVMKGT